MAANYTVMSGPRCLDGPPSAGRAAQLGNGHVNWVRTEYGSDNEGLRVARDGPICAWNRGEPGGIRTFNLVLDSHTGARSTSHFVRTSSLREPTLSTEFARLGGMSGDRWCRDGAAPVALIFKRIAS